MISNERFVIQRSLHLRRSDLRKHLFPETLTLTPIPLLLRIYQMYLTLIHPHTITILIEQTVIVNALIHRLEVVLRMSEGWHMKFDGATRLVHSLMD